MWKAWGKKEAEEVASGFYARIMGTIDGFGGFSLKIVLEKSLAAVWVRGVAREKKRLTLGGHNTGHR